MTLLKKSTAALALVFTAALATAQTAEEAVPQIDWQYGPGTADIGGIAQINIPAGFLFAGAADTRTLMEMMENPVSGTELGFLAPEDSNWFIVFEFEDIGYIKDDQKDSLDSDAMLESLREATKQGNKIRKQRGWGTLEIAGWVQKPFYNTETNNLEWGTRAIASEGGESINYNTRFLGRKGVMSVTLVTGPEDFELVRSDYQTALSGFNYTSGNRYAEWRSGDKIAEYGLAGLVVGGGAALAAKTGFLAKFWKVLIIPFVLLAGFVKKLFGGGKD